MGKEQEGSTELPPELWPLLKSVREGAQVEWSTPDGETPIGVTRYGLEPDGWLVILSDLSGQRISLAQQLYHSTQEEFARLIAAAAHDLRSPLSSMTFNVGVLRRRLGELPLDQAQKLLAEIAACCEWQDRSITSLVEASKAQQTVAVPLGPLFARIEQMLRPMFRERRSELRIELDPELRVQGTQLQLEHIFVNLLSNAVQSRPEGVRVWVRQPERTNPTRGRAPLLVEVVDDGPGVPEEHRARIFDPFFTTKLQGSGVGLCLAREAARALGGDLVLLPSDEGACFQVRLEPPPRGPLP
ncbi:MAG: HAMP domain-containing histidine kinase [Deltaproteobacteria bacterium]|nr:HAMP domain-containing histidine kinase [Deltaproteobacteria bacterium]